MSSSSNPRNQNQWRFTFETLAHIPTLRLYLFSPNLIPSRRCLSIKSDLQLSRSLLVVSWIDSEKSEDVSVRVPVPRVLIDLEAEVEVGVKVDHIEIKMQLVLPVDHPVVVNLSGDLDRFRPFELDSDLKNLSSGDVHLFCKACSNRLTRQPLRHFLEMPSVNWREVADNWFGACCCSFGGISEKLVLQYIKAYECAEGTCLLDSASVIICKDDLDGYAFHKSVEQSDSSYKADSPNGTEKVKGRCQNVTENIQKNCDHRSEAKLSHLESDSLGCESHTNSLSCTLTSSKDHFDFVRGHHSISMEDTDLTQLNLNKTQIAVVVDSLRLNHGSANSEKLIPQSADGISKADHCHCCPDEVKVVADLRPCVASLALSETYGPDRIQKWLHDCSLGSGFLSRSSNLSKDVEWIEFLCKRCSSMLGVYPSDKHKNEPVDGGIRLFKCYISTNVSVGGPLDIFRQYTLERVFVSLLLECAKDELSYRIVLRDLKSKSPMLQIVLLNSESWCCTGYCLENETAEPLPEVNLKPVVKVLFSDCRTATEASSRIIKDWSSKTHTEDIYMMTHQIEELTKCLELAAVILPYSCSCLQGMSLSFIER